MIEKDIIIELIKVILIFERVGSYYILLLDVLSEEPNLITAKKSFNILIIVPFSGIVFILYNILIKLYKKFKKLVYFI